MTRQQLHEMMDQVPEESLPHLADILDELVARPASEAELWQDEDYSGYVRAKIAEGEACYARGEALTQEEVAERMAGWIKK